MVKLPDNDPIFRARILAVDSDTTVSAKAARHGNIIKLPCVQGSSGTNRSPENTIKNFLRMIANANDGPFLDAMLGLHSIFQSRYEPEEGLIGRYLVRRLTGLKRAV